MALWHLRRAVNFKVCSVIQASQNYQFLFHSPQKLCLNGPYAISSFRHFSWEGFYYSLSVSAPVVTIQNCLVDFHSFSGLPWWAIIMVTTLGIRSLCVFPLAVHQHQVIGRLSNIRVELGKMTPQLNKEVNIAKKLYGWDELSCRKIFNQSMREHYQKFILRDNCHPFKIALLGLFQIPVWMFFSISLRNLSLNPWALNVDALSLQQQFQTEGVLWFTNLTMPDCFYIPVLLGLVNLALIEIHTLKRVGQSSKFQKVLLYASRFIAVAVAGVATLNPTSVTLYWLSSSSFGLVQCVILLSPKCRQILRIPITMNESSTPFRDIAQNFKKRFMP